MEVEDGIGRISGDAKPQQTEKMLQRMAVLQLILYIRIKGGDVRRVNSVSDRLREQEKAKWGSVWDLG